MELTRIWEILKRRKWIIIQAVLIVGLTAFLGSFFIQPSYQSSSKILIKRAKRSVQQQSQELIGLPGLSSMIIRTHADVDVNKVLATSEPYVGQMIEKLQIRDSNGNLIKTNKLLQTGIATTIRGKIFAESGNISISQYAGTSILEIKAVSSKPREAKMMATTLSDIMVEQNQNLIREEYAIARRFVEEQMSRVRDRFTNALQEVTEFRKKEQTIDLKLETKLASESMAEKLKQKEAAVIELAQSRGKLAELQSQLKKLSPEFLPSDTLKESPQIEIIKKRIMNLDLQISQASTEFTKKHPRIVSLNEQMDLARKELRREIAVYQKSAPQLIALQRQIAATEAYLAGVNADIKKFLTDLGGIPDKVFRQETLAMELNVTQQIYRSLLDSLYEIQMGEVTTLGEIRIVEKARVPFAPVSPNKTVNGILGMFLGLLFGLGLVFVMEYLDDTIRKAVDMDRFKPVPMIGMIPRFVGKTIPAMMHKDPNDPLFESYRSIRNYLWALPSPMKTLLVTSPGPDEGKTTTVVNLGISIAREGKRVVMVDMDLRRPNLHKHFRQKNDVGLSDVIQGNVLLAEAIKTTPVEGVHILSCGSPYQDPGGVIESDGIEKVLSELARRFDTIIVDSAPALVKSDAVVLAPHLDGTIVVVESEKTTCRAVHALLNSMAKARTKPLGIILNGVSIPRGKHYYQAFYLGHHQEGLSWSESKV